MKAIGDTLFDMLMCALMVLLIIARGNSDFLRNWAHEQ